MWLLCLCCPSSDRLPAKLRLLMTRSKSVDGELAPLIQARAEHQQRVDQIRSEAERLENDEARTLAEAAGKVSDAAWPHALSSNKDNIMRI